MKVFILYTEEQNIKAGKEKKRHIMYRVTKVIMPTVILNRTHAILKEWGKIYNKNPKPKMLGWLSSSVERKKKGQSRILYPATNWEKTFLDKQKLKEFVASRPTLQGM